MVRITPVVALVACSTAVRGFMAESTTDAGAIDIGEFRSMDAFYAHLGTTAKDWDDIEAATPAPVGRTDRRDADLAGDGFFNTPNSGTLVPRSICATRSDWQKIICEDMPNHKWQYAHYPPLPMKYTTTNMEGYLMQLVTSIRDGRDRKTKYRPHTGPVSLNSPISSEDVKFSVPISAVHPVENITDGNPAVNMHYLFNNAENTIYYQGATLSIGGDSMRTNEVSGTPDFNNITEDVAATNDYPVHPAATWNYTLLIQVWRQTNYPPTTHPACIAQVIKWHIDHAAAKHRQVCTQLEQLGGWWAWLKITINKGKRTNDNFGCCEGNPKHREKRPL